MSRIEYLARIPSAVPPGRIVAHNNVRPQRTIGRNGFRAWLDDPGDKYEPCPCGWEVLRGEDGVDPWGYVLSLNVHRRHLTTEQKRSVIAGVIAARPERSDRRIAKDVRASPTTVGKVRADMEARGTCPPVDTRTDARGRQQPAHKPPLRLPEDVDLQYERAGRAAVAKQSPPTQPDPAPKPTAAGNAPVHASKADLFTVVMKKITDAEERHGQGDERAIAEVVTTATGEQLYAIIDHPRLGGAWKKAASDELFIKRKGGTPVSQSVDDKRDEPEQPQDKVQRQTEHLCRCWDATCQPARDQFMLMVGYVARVRA